MYLSRVQSAIDEALDEDPIVMRSLRFRHNCDLILADRVPRLLERPCWPLLDPIDSRVIMVSCSIARRSSASSCATWFDGPLGPPGRLACCHNRRVDLMSLVSHCHKILERLILMTRSRRLVCGGKRSSHLLRSTSSLTLAGAANVRPYVS
ncbi:unnamed protein product [Trichogramma brassicae]|uniref:Uncharacterized protein n=1 Tax=Trichogramma brassicae TaxID=86971 RepID=A0A6H5J8X1_9HYME|nr:unnamed protein product [Trichogramma brassicae]